MLCKTKKWKEPIDSFQKYNMKLALSYFEDGE